jgi:hypothetical protein
VDQPLTDEEKAILKTGVFGAVFLVSNANPGVLSLIKESFAASGAIAGARGVVMDAVTTGELPKLPSDPAGVEAAVLPALRRSIEILRAKAPEELDNYRATVVRATDDVARASEGVDQDEAAMLKMVRDALGVPG